MDFERFYSWLNENKDWLFSGAGVVFVSAFVGFVWKRRKGQSTDSSVITIDQNVKQGRQNLQVGQASGDVHYHAGGAQVDVNELVTTILDAQTRQQDAAGNRIDELVQGHEETQQQFRQLTKAVSALLEQRSEPDEPLGIDAAIEQLSEGKTDAAEALFAEILERKKAEGEASLKEAAAAARHLGALAYIHDTQKAISAYTQAVELDPDDPDGWNRFGHLRHRIGDLDGAVEAYERVLALGNRISDKAIMAVAYGSLGIVYGTLGDLTKAEEFFRKSLALNEELGRKEGMARDYGNLGIVYQMRGDLAKAEKHFLKSLAINEELGLKGGLASQYGNLGNIYQKRGDLVKAEEYHLKSLAIEEELGRKGGLASQYGNLGLVYETSGDLAKAEEYYFKALTINQELGHKEGMASAYGNLGNVYRARGDLAKAEEFYRKSLAIEQELGRKEGMANAYGNLGLLYRRQRDLAKACEAWRTSRRLFKDVGAAPEIEKTQALMDEAGCGPEEADTKDEEG